MSNQRCFILAGWLFLGGSGVFGVLPVPVDYGLNIAVRPMDGLHALPYWYYTNGIAQIASLWVWTSDPEAGREVRLPGWTRTMWPQVQFLGTDRVVVVDMTANYTGGRATTWTITNQAAAVIVDDLRFGDDGLRWGGSAALQSGGLAFLNYNQSGPNVIFDLTYRRPDVPPTPGPAAVPSSPWWTNRFSLPGTSEIPSSNWAMTELDRKISVFFTRDSAAVIGLIQFVEQAGTLVITNYNNGYIKGDSTNGIFDPMAPHGELPDIAARSFNGQIFAMYQGNYATEYRCGDNFCRPLIIGIKPDLSREILLRTPYYTERVIGLTCFARPDGIYYVQQNADLAICNGPYILASTTRGIIKPLDVHGGLASSPDGWLAYFGGPTGFTIERVDFRPKLSIAETSTLTRAQVLSLSQQAAANPAMQVFVPPKNVSITWDPLPTFTNLQDSADLKNWKTRVPNAVPPVVVPATNQADFFRLSD